MRFDVQVGDRDVKEVHMKNTCVQDCAVEALRLRKTRVKMLSLSNNNVNVLITRKKHALARLQLVLYASMILNSGVN